MQLEELLDGCYAAPHAVDSDIFAKAFRFVEPNQVRALGLYPYYRPLEQNDGPVARIRGHEVVMLGSNNYLGLTMQAGP